MSELGPVRAKPKRIGRYQLLFRIASGGMADVYAAITHGEEGFAKVCAIKLMREQLSDDDDFVKMFIDEGKIASNIHSPHVVTTHDLGRHDDGSLYIAMELVVGSSLWEIFRQTHRARVAFPVPIAIEIIAQTALGLHAAHEARTPLGASLNVIHRDVSPQNILIDAHGGVRLTDFGIAHAMERATHTVGQEIKGKYAYCSPEQIQCTPLDRRSDIFSLGVVAWELLTGEQLFATHHPLQTMKRVLSGEIARLEQTRPDLPPAAAALIHQCLNREPEKRPSTAADFAQALRMACARANIVLGAPALGAFVSKHAPRKMVELEQRLHAALNDEDTIESLATRDSSAPASGISRRPLLLDAMPGFGRDGPGKSSRPRWFLLALVIGILVGGVAAIYPTLSSPDPDTPPVNSVSPTEVQAGAPSPQVGEVSAPAPQPTPEPAPLPTPVPVAENTLTDDIEEPDEQAEEVSPAQAPQRAERPRRRRPARGTGASRDPTPNRESNMRSSRRQADLPRGIFPR